MYQYFYAKNKSNSMKEKIFQQLKHKYSNLGLTEDVVRSVAESLGSTGLITDDNLETAVAGQESMLKSYQSSLDKMRTESANYKKELEELRGKGGGQQQQPDKNEEPDWFKKYREEQDEKIRLLTSENDKVKEEKARAERHNLILDKAKSLKISKERIEEGFAITDDMDDNAIDTYLSKVRQNEVAKGLEEKGSAFSVSTSKEKSKELAKDWAKSLPDAN